MKPNHALFIWHFMLALCIYGDATLVNRTIDDKFGDSAAGRIVTHLPDGEGFCFLGETESDTSTFDVRAQSERVAQDA